MWRVLTSFKQYCRVLAATVVTLQFLIYCFSFCYFNKIMYQVANNIIVYCNWCLKSKFFTLPTFESSQVSSFLHQNTSGRVYFFYFDNILGTYECTCWVFLFLSVNLAGEGVTQSDGCKQHLNTNDEVLIPSSHRACPNCIAMDNLDFWNGPCSLQYGQEHSW